MGMESLDFTGKPESKERLKTTFDIAVEEFLLALSDVPHEGMSETERELSDAARKYIEDKYPNRTLH